jgi:phasin family protein
MFNTPEQFAAANKASVDALLTLANTALASAERIAALNLNTARSVLEDGVANAKALLGAKDPQEFFSVQASLAQPSLEKAVAYSRSVYEISAQSKGRVRQAARSTVRRLPEAVSLPAREGHQECASRFRYRRLRRQVGNRIRQFRFRQLEQGCQAGCRYRRSERRRSDQRHCQGCRRHCSKRQEIGRDLFCSKA